MLLWGSQMWMLAACVAAAQPVALDVADRIVAVEPGPGVQAVRPEPAAASVDGPWRIVRTAGGVRTWEAPLPARTRTLFFHRPPADMALRRGNQTLRHKPAAHAVADTWTFDAHSIHVRRRAGDGPPGADLTLKLTKAAERQADLWTGTDDLTELVVRSVQIDDTARHGLWLPAGTRVRVEIPAVEGGELRFDTAAVPPELASTTTHARASSSPLSVHDAAGATLLRTEPHIAHWSSHRVPLDAAAPTTVEFEAGLTDNIDSDGIFIASPRVVFPGDAAPKVVVIFVDTLRADALSLSGYSRATTPNLDAWAREAAVFTEARSVAPWTLPSARTMFSGVAPERWGRVDTVPERLRRHGWASAFIAGNVYLSSNFDMNRGWGSHRILNWPQATTQVARAERWLAEHADEPAFLVLHLMDMHLPYTEPEPFRSRFAGPTPERLSEGALSRPQIERLDGGPTDAEQAWLRDRYDNNLAYVDATLAPFLAGLPEDATVIFLSDHGEEFWDHGGFEHGHTLHEELLRVPMIVRGPGVAPGTYSAPVSLLDVAPTVLRAAGIDVELPGLALQDVASGAAGPLTDRAVAFGRPLYGRRRWGVLRNQHKYTTWKHTETLVDLGTDPEEAHNLIADGADPLPWRTHLAEGLRRDVHLAWTLYPSRSRTKHDTTVEITVPVGIVAAWSAEDPLLSSEVSTELDGTTVRHTWSGGQRGTRAAYVVPSGDSLALLPGAQLQVALGSEQKPIPVPPDPPSSTAREAILGRARVGGRTISLSLSVVPLPPDDTTGLAGFDDEVAEELEALGYIDD